MGGRLSKEEQKTGDATLLQTEGQKAGWGLETYFFFSPVSVFFPSFLVFTVYIYHIFAIFNWDI